jgi:hypothetical protein
LQSSANPVIPSEARNPFFFLSINSRGIPRVRSE